MSSGPFLNQNELGLISLFHSHLGPFTVLGGIAAKNAMIYLNPKRARQISCVVETVPKQPYLCVLDGIQVISFCTMGKGNLIFNPLEENKISLTLKFETETRKIVFKLKNIQELLDKVKDVKNLEKLANRINMGRIEDLFEIERG